MCREIVEHVGGNLPFARGNVVLLPVITRHLQPLPCTLSCFGIPEETGGLAGLGDWGLAGLL
jgi:hypothetical protein